MLNMLHMSSSSSSSSLKLYLIYLGLSLCSFAYPYQRLKLNNLKCHNNEWFSGPLVHPFLIIVFCSHIFGIKCVLVGIVGSEPLRLCKGGHNG